MGPKLKRRLKHQGVHLLFGVVKKGAGSQPRFVEKFTSRKEINGKGWFSASHVEKETSPFDKCIFAFKGTMHSRHFLSTHHFKCIIPAVSNFSLTA
jgi:hypothetical protein